MLDLYDGHSVFLDNKGYPTIWKDSKNQKVHVIEWEKAHGAKPKGYEIHHKDFNKANYSLDNLELLSNSDHQKIHAGWIRTNGEWTHKPCNHCGELLPLDSFYPRKGYTPSALCRKCTIKTQVEINKDNQKTKDRKARWYQENKDRLREKRKRGGMPIE